MRFEPRHAFHASAPYRFRSGPPLPPQLAILGDALGPAMCEAVAMLARRHQTCPVRELVANGLWSEARYYATLAQQLDLPFIDGWPDLPADIDPVAYAVAGRIRLSDGSWLCAPQGDELARFCSDGSHPRCALTTPAHLLAILHRAAQANLGHLASNALPDTAPRLSARNVTPRATCVVALMLAAFVVAAFEMPRLICDGLGALFFAAMSLRLLATAGGRTAFGPPPPMVDDDDLPDYTVLVPLHEEAAILPHLLDALGALDYPPAKLQVLILLEPEDRATRDALSLAALPPWLHVVFGPVGETLRTKPRALNLGLAAARGSFLTVYDAEDRPAPDQLRRAAARFAADPGLACLQARLSMVATADAPLLDRLFAIEYAALFAGFNVGLARAGLPIPLGGTSNHFRTNVLRGCGGWDAWNVTEDADLGLRLARFGHRVDCLDSTTWETAPDTLPDWMRQRSRWAKGWMQTLLVLARDLPQTMRDLGPYRAGIVGLILFSLVVGPLALPACTGWFVYQLAWNGWPSPGTWQEIAEATLATSVLVTGLAAPIWCGYAGLRAERRLGLAPWLPLLWPYQLMISAAAWYGFWDLLHRPFHWHKTPHRPRQPGSVVHRP